jgi:hypothetical protein
VRGGDEELGGRLLLGRPAAVMMSTPVARDIATTS